MAVAKPTLVPRWASLIAWQAAHYYTVGERATNDSGKLYACVTAGTSAGSGGPTGTGAGIADGTAAWDYIGANAPAWVAATGYAEGDRVTNGGNLYECTDPGTSAASGGPTGSNSAIVDGGVIWIYLAAATAVVTTPPTTMQDVGWVPGQLPPAQYFNWILFNVYLWLLWLQDLTNQALTWTAAHIFQKGLTATQSTTNGTAIGGTGNGTGSGVAGTGGASDGTGVRGVGGATNGYGVTGNGTGSGSGGVFTGGSSSGAGVQGVGGTGNAHGVTGAGTGNHDGVNGSGGPTGAGVRGAGGATSGPGVRGTGTAGNANGVEGVGQGTGAGVSGTGGASSGSGGEFTGGGTNGLGCFGQGTGNGPGGEFQGGSGGGDGVVGAGDGAGYGGRFSCANAASVAVHGLNGDIEAVGRIAGGQRINGDQRGRRFQSNGTPYDGTEFILGSGWGSTGAVTAVHGTDAGFEIEVTCGGSGIAANPTIQVTFKDGTWVNVPLVLVALRNSDDATGIGKFLSWIPTLTTNIWTFFHTPGSGKKYYFVCTAQGID